MLGWNFHANHCHISGERRVLKNRIAEAHKCVNCGTMCGSIYTILCVAILNGAVLEPRDIWMFILYAAVFDAAVLDAWFFMLRMFYMKIILNLCHNYRSVGCCSLGYFDAPNSISSTTLANSFKVSMLKVEFWSSKFNIFLQDQVHGKPLQMLETYRGRNESESGKNVIFTTNRMDSFTLTLGSLLVMSIGNQPVKRLMWRLTSEAW